MLKIIRHSPFSSSWLSPFSHQNAVIVMLSDGCTLQILPKPINFEIGSMHPSESGIIDAFCGEKGESQLDEKGNVFNTFNQLLTCKIDIYSPFCPLSLS